MMYEKTVVVNKKTADRIRLYLEYGGQEEDINVTHTAIFDNGMEMDIKCCGVRDDKSWTEAVLFSNGCEVFCTEVNEDYFGDWIVNYAGDTYIAHVLIEGDKPYVCLRCGKKLSFDEAYNDHGGIYCDDCFDEARNGPSIVNYAGDTYIAHVRIEGDKPYACLSCGKKLSADEAHESFGRIFCTDCFDEMRITPTCTSE